MNPLATLITIILSIWIWLINDTSIISTPTPGWSEYNVPWVRVPRMCPE